MISSTHAVVNTANKSKLYKIASGVFVSAILIVAAITFSLSFGGESRYFISSPITTAFYVTLGAGVLFTMSSLVVFKGDAIRIKSGAVSAFFSCLSAVSTAVLFIYYIYGDIATQNPGSSQEIFWRASAVNTSEKLIAALILVCIPALLYCVCKAFRLNKTLTLFLGYLRILFFALIIATLYLDFSVELNTPVKLIIQFAAAAAMLGTVSDLRVIIGRAHAATFMLSKLSSMMLSSLALITLVTEILPGVEKYGNDYIIFSIVLAVCGAESAFEFFTSIISAHFDVQTEIDHYDEEVEIAKNIYKEENEKTGEDLNTMTEQGVGEESAGVQSDSTDEVSATEE